MAFVFHGTPLSPHEALIAAGARGYCVSFYHFQDLATIERIAPFVMYDNGAFSYWMQAVRAGVDPIEAGRTDWRDYYEFLEPRLFQPGRWAIIPDRPAAPSQINDGLLNDWPHGVSRGAPVWHMDGPIDRLLRLCERYDRVCLGWIGHPKREPVGCDGYRRRMDEVAAAFGNIWPATHMLRGIAVGGDYPFVSCDSTSLAQNHHRYRLRLFAGTADEWTGVTAYADRLERMAEPDARLCA